MFWSKNSQLEANKSHNTGNPAVSLVPEVKRIMFSFFNRNDLHQVGRVCKAFNTVAKNILEQAPEYYTTGAVIELYNKSGSMLIKHSPEELKHSTIKSISQPAILRLFKTEADALDYARATRVDTDSWYADDISPIFKVRYLGSQPDSNWQPLTVLSPDLRQVTLSCLEVNNKHVHILTGQLKYDRVRGMDNLVALPVIKFVDDKDVTKDGEASRCSIS